MVGSIDGDVHAEVAAVHAELTAALAEIDRPRGLLGLDRPEPQSEPDGRLFSLSTPLEPGQWRCCGDPGVDGRAEADPVPIARDPAGLV